MKYENEVRCVVIGAFVVGAACIGAGVGVATHEGHHAAAKVSHVLTLTGDPDTDCLALAHKEFASEVCDPLSATYSDPSSNHVQAFTQEDASGGYTWATVQSLHVLAPLPGATMCDASVNGYPQNFYVDCGDFIGLGGTYEK